MGSKRKVVTTSASENAPAGLPAFRCDLSFDSTENRVGMTRGAYQQIEWVRQC
jgi:primosomal replication protein N